MARPRFFSEHKTLTLKLLKNESTRLSHLLSRNTIVLVDVNSAPSDVFQILTSSLNSKF